MVRIWTSLTKKHYHFIQGQLKHLEQKNHYGSYGDNKKCTDVKYSKNIYLEKNKNERLRDDSPEP